MCYWFSGDLIPAYWCVIDSQVTSFQHTDVLLTLRWPHSSILMCYWFSGYLIPAYWGIIDSHGTAFQLTNVLTILVWPYSSILKYCWFSGDLMLAYWCVIDSHVTSFQHTEVLLILMVPHYEFWLSLCKIVRGSVILLLPLSSILTYVLLILMWPHSSILICYWFSCDLIPAYWGIVDSQVISF